eukprot:8416347-Ditylum_brightwellii.AAC.1
MAYSEQIKKIRKLEPLPCLDDLALMGKGGSWRLCHSLLSIINLYPSYSSYIDYEKKMGYKREAEVLVLYKDRKAALQEESFLTSPVPKEEKCQAQN